MRWWPGFFYRPVAVQVSPELSAHRIFAHQAPYKPYWSNNSIEHDTQNDPGVDLAQDVAYCHPPFVDPKKTFGIHCGGTYETDCCYQRPPSRVAAAENDRPKTYYREDAANG
jgi:hypothetical protein